MVTCFNNSHSRKQFLPCNVKVKLQVHLRKQKMNEGRCVWMCIWFIIR